MQSKIFFDLVQYWPLVNSDLFLQRLTIDNNERLAILPFNYYESFSNKLFASETINHPINWFTETFIPMIRYAASTKDVVDRFYIMKLLREIIDDDSIGADLESWISTTLPTDDFFGTLIQFLKDLINLGFDEIKEVLGKEESIDEIYDAFIHRNDEFKLPTEEVIL